LERRHNATPINSRPNLIGELQFVSSNLERMLDAQLFSEENREFARNKANLFRQFIRNIQSRVSDAFEL